MLFGSKQSNALRRPKRKEFSDKHLDIPITFGVLLQISPEFEVATNVPHLVIHHSPTGYSFGHGGSGPADLALNILQWFMEYRQWQGPTTKCFDGNCFQRAWDLHQEFKWKFIAPLITCYEKIDYQVIMDWLEAKL